MVSSPVPKTCSEERRLLFFFFGSMSANSDEPNISVPQFCVIFGCLMQYMPKYYICKRATRSHDS